MTSAPSTDFTAQLVDVHPDGTPMSVCDGILRLSPGQLGELRHIQILLGATSHTFLRRHRIRLDISSSNFPRFDPNPNTGDSSLHARACVVAHQTIVHGGATPSSLVLPVVPAPA
jgi:putative CocE/NonD family hydrolase